MIHLFSPTGKRLLESLSFTRTLYAFDFDGTLAPIAPLPELANAPLATEGRLGALATHAPVAVVSGRSVADLQAKLRLDGVHFIGNHGLENEGTHPEALELAASVRRDWAAQLKRSWGELGSDRGVFIEDKTYSLALHYRRSRSRKAARAALLARIERLRPTPRLITGKCVLNLVPEYGPHKGMALLRLLARLDLRCAFYVGDDDTDEDVFSMPDAPFVTARVGRKKSSHARFYLKSRSEVSRLIETLARAYARGGPA